MILFYILLLVYIFLGRSWRITFFDLVIDDRSDPSEAWMGS